MFRTGLVSVTFRQLPPEEIISLAVRAGLEGIEWGGDVHVPCGDPAAAARVGEATRRAGLTVFSYGSYYRAGQNPEDFSCVVETARALGAPHVRIWAGEKGSAEAEDGERARVTEDCRRAGLLAKKAGLAVSAEFHGGTLTDTPDSALRLIREAGISTYWQPNQFRDRAYNLHTLEAVLPYVTGVHVFTWRGREWLPLAQGEEDWMAYLALLREDGAEHPLMMEFVPGHEPSAFLRDAKALLTWAK